MQANKGKCLRIYLTVCLVCQTLIDPPKDGEEIKRENLTCKITYCSVGKHHKKKSPNKIGLTFLHFQWTLVVGHPLQFYERYTNENIPSSSNVLQIFVSNNVKISQLCFKSFIGFVIAPCLNRRQDKKRKQRIIIKFIKSFVYI